jgi:hypothetical protein
MRRIAIASASLVIVLLPVFFYLRRDTSYDRSFDTRVAAPAYQGAGPVVLYDEGHRNTHLSTTGYKPFVDMIRNDGYVVRTSKGVLTASEMRGVGVLVLVLPRGANPTEDSSAYTEAECAAIAEWVAAGGSLLLVSDHWPYGLATSSLARRFAVYLSGGFTEDPKYHDPERGESHLVFSRENGLLGEHPITRGVNRVLTFTGTSMKGPDGAAYLLALSDSATDRPAGPARIERSGGDVRVLMEYGDPRPAGGYAQGIALAFGRGRVVLLGEAGMLRAQKDRTGLVGMNVPGYDNRQLALNIMHWLSRAGEAAAPSPGS